MHKDGANEEHPTQPDSREPDGPRISYEIAREEARLILEGEVGRLRELRAREAQRRWERRDRSLTDGGGPRDADPVESRDKRADAIRKQSRSVRNDGPVYDKQASIEAGPQEREHSPDNKVSRSRTLVIGGPPLLRKAKRQSRPSSGEQPRSSQQGHSRTDSVGRTEESRSKPMPPMNAPNFDAPVSAVNAGERRVNVQGNTTSITLPVTPSTTCKDILNAASASMSESIDPRTAILLESFSQLGLERPLRRYERIRDVMNSWDNDAQNHLFIMTEGECAARRLGLGDAPRQQPEGATVQIYHSHRPGHWDKRWVKLREDGQITISKKENCIDSTNICHLSDFDLYTPTAKQVKKLKPPKKLCFALKSQEKSSMFLRGANFVHFFCTKDKMIADRWYEAVHSWRSWYLVNMLGEGQQARTEPAIRQPSRGQSSHGHPKDLSPHMVGSFKAVSDDGHSMPSRERSRKTNSGVSHRPSQDLPRPLIDSVPGRPTTTSKPGSPTSHAKPPAFPPTAFPGNLMAEPAHSGNADDAEGPFTGTGLLARSMSRRSQGGSRSGRGVQGADGKPLVDIHPTSEFTDGSLLRRMEAIAAQQGVTQPKIDREKRREVNVSVGEGFD